MATDLIGPQGPQGPKGDKGDTGPQGLLGPQGLPGPQGSVGPAGQRGPQGLPGDAGPQGDIGPRGEIGPRGVQGPQGDQGVQGLQGAQGAQGDVSLIAAPMTLYVATTGDDVGGAGTLAAPYASITRALNSLVGKRIASGATVAILVADGTYTIVAPIRVDHPDADKIKILGNIGAETIFAIASIDTAARKFVAAGDKTATVGLSVGDKITVTGSATTALNASYTIASISYTGGNTEIVVSEAVPSATVGGASLTAKPCNRCVLTTSGDVTIFIVSKTLNQLAGFRMNGPGTTGAGITTQMAAYALIYKCIINGFLFGIDPLSNSFVDLQNTLIRSCTYGLYTTGGAQLSNNSGTAVVVDRCGYAVTAVTGGMNICPGAVMTVSNYATAGYTPALGVFGASAGYNAASAS